MNAPPPQPPGQPPEPPEQSPEPPARPGADDPELAVRVAGGLVSLIGGVVVAVATLILVPLRMETPFGLVRVPVAVAFVVVANLLLVWFAHQAVGVRWAGLLPAAGWFLIALTAMGSTGSGNTLLMPNDWVGALALFAGTAVMAVGVFRALVRNPPR